MWTLYKNQSNRNEGIVFQKTFDKIIDGTSMELTVWENIYGEIYYENNYNSAGYFFNTQKKNEQTEPNGSKNKNRKTKGSTFEK